MKLKILLLIALLFSLVACGQSGNLYLPEKPEKSTTTTKS